MNSRRTFLAALPLLSLGAMPGAFAAESKAPANPKTVDEIKKLFPFGEGWQECVFQGRKFLFCLSVVPAADESSIDALGWIFNEHAGEWRTIFNVETHSVGHAELQVDAEKGSVAMRGLANNELKGVDLFTFDLRAASNDAGDAKKGK